MSISDPVVRDTQGMITFTTSPEGSTITFTVGGDVYVSDQKITAMGTAITFTATGDIDDAIRFEWDFGDGEQGVGNPVTHTYRIPNPHIRASLKVTTRRGHHLFASRQLYVKDTAPGSSTVVRF